MSAARIEEYMPKITPIMAEMEKARIGATGVTIMVMPQKVEMKICIFNQGVLTRPNLTTECY